MQVCLFLHLMPSLILPSICMIFGSLGVEISFETLIWNKKTQWSLYLGMGLVPLVVLNPSA